jgi:hypothetical protein
MEDDVGGDEGVECVDATHAAITSVEKDSTVQVNRGRYIKNAWKQQSKAKHGEERAGNSDSLWHDMADAIHAMMVRCREIRAKRRCVRHLMMPLIICHTVAAISVTRAVPVPITWPIQQMRMRLLTVWMLLWMWMRMLLMWMRMWMWVAAPSMRMLLRVRMRRVLHMWRVLLLCVLLLKVVREMMRVV